MVHDDLLTRRLPSASRRDATPFLRPPPSLPLQYLRGYIPRKRFNPLPLLPSLPLSGIEQHVCSNFFDIPFSFFLLVLFFSSFFFTLLFAFRIGNRERNEESSTNARDFRKITESIVPSRFQPPSSLSLVPRFVFFLLGPSPPSPLLPPKNFSSDSLQRFVF